MDLESERESDLTSLISQIVFTKYTMSTGSDSDSDSDLDLLSLQSAIIAQMLSLARSMDMDSQPKPESEFMSLTTQIISLINPKKLDSLPKPESQLQTFIAKVINSIETLELDLGPELMSLIHQIFSHIISMHAKSGKFIFLRPQVQVRLKEGKFCVEKEVSWSSNNKWQCLPSSWKKFRLTEEDTIYFLCGGCNGENHQEYEQAPIEVEHLLHPKHSLQLVLSQRYRAKRECYCCDINLAKLFYYCSNCDFAMNIACVQKLPVFYIRHPKWHEHPLHLFCSQASLTCGVCALVHSSSPFYMCPPCGFVVHQSCISLPHIIRISRHLHRISFTHFFTRDWCCGVCRRMIDNDYGGYSCIKEGCSYASHSKCATQRNVWDGKDLEGEPEEIEEEVLEPFVRISDGIIQHFSHQHHHLRLDENTDIDYDDNKQCQACIKPIYFGNFYYCLQCDDFILHEACAKLPRKMYNPIHPHLLTLVAGYNGVMDYLENLCSACHWWCTAGFFYKCSEKGCRFQLHVQCATISEPLVHGSHIHPLFLTSKPGEGRLCGVCIDFNQTKDETFNCIECEFALCFACATLPQKVRYKHDKHMLTLSYGEGKSTMTHWCEVCEGKVNPKRRFYKCDEYCCVTLHIECLMGKELYMKPGSSFFFVYKMLDVLPNKMCRPLCSKCKKRCPHKLVFKWSGLIYCSLSCIPAKYSR